MESSEQASSNIWQQFEFHKTSFQTMNSQQINLIGQTVHSFRMLPVVKHNECSSLNELNVDLQKKIAFFA